MKKRILSLLLVLVMLLSLLSAGVLAAEGDVSVTLSGMHDAQVKSLKLYTYMDGVKGADDLLAEKTAADGAYTIDLAPGAYWVDGYDANNDRNGGVVIDVSSDSSSFKLQRMYQISVNPNSWVKDTDYTLSLRVTDASGAERKAEFGSAVNWGKTYTSCLFVVGDTVSVTATPNAETHPNYNPATASKTPTMNDSLSLTCKEFVTVTVTAPKGSTIDAGTLAKYYVFSFLEPFARSVEDGTATFHLDKNTDYFYRVRHPQGATYWNYVRLSADAAYTVTDEDLGLTGDFSKDTIYHFENNIYDRAGIYLNINTKGYKNMVVGETFELNSFRNWFAIESFMNAKVALPEMHYQVIDVNGNASDVVTITPNALNSNVAVMEAKHEGTAIVLVTYDAMTHMVGQTSTASHRFSAIWPELTGVFVVNVGADGSAIQTNMNLDRMDAVIEKDEARQLDAEHDILFYTGTEGASYSFKPEAGCTVSVLRPTVTAASMTYSGGFTNTGVTTAEDGTVTVSGLITGRNIIKVTKGGLSTYQVVTARGVSYKFVNAEGTELTQEELAAIKPGDSVTIQFSNLISPKEKLSGAYNFNFSLYMQGPDGTFFKSDPGGNFGVYDFSGNSERQKLTVTIPKFWAEETYTLSGAIKQAGWPGVPTHRGITYAVGTNPGFDAPKTAGLLSRLPEITIPVVKLDFLTGKLIFQDQNGTAIDRKDLTVTLADSAGNGIAVAEDGTFKAYAEEYFYTVSGAGVEYATGSVTMKEEGPNEFTITLQATAAGAWDGKTQTEPKADENGVYRIGTGAELAWFVAKSKDADVSGVLTADINLSKYAWLNITSSKKVTLDGAGFEITGLNATAGLFTQIGSNSYIHDLTIRGAVSGKGNAGAIAGYASGTAPKIANCFNYAVITSTGNNVGGLVGYTYQNAVIENCANFGAVTGGSSVGGIIGGTVGNGSTITGCYNTAEISATGSKAGGIIGGTSSEMTVTSCYNTGKISGTASGGIAGEVKGNVNWSGTVQGKITISSCYSTGEAGSAVFGTVDTASSEISKCYYLNTLNADANAEALNEADLKDADLSDAFGPVCGGYPALRWQTDVTFHEAAGEGTVTAPLCTVKGYTSYSCSKCGKSYRTAYTAPLGHDFCEDLDGSDNSCVLTAPTCTQPGKIVRTCRRDGCSETKEDIVPAKGHTEVIDAAVEATCTTPGKTEGKHCSVCHTVTVEQKEIPAKGHTEVIDQAVEATCTEPGKTAGKHCSVCNAVLVAQKVVSAKGHDWDSGKILKQPTYGENGEMLYTCAICDEYKAEIIPKLVNGGGGTGGAGGGSSSAGSTTKTETTINPDESTTKTETKPDGTMVETTTGKDGSTSKTTTKKDGSSVTESKTADGTTGTVKTDKDGKTEAETKISNKAVEDAKKSSEAVKVPTEVKAGEDSNSAPTVKVELPKNAGETKIEIPVSDVNSGTVAVIVHEDGTEEIVKNSKPTEDGVQLTVDGNTVVKIIDNSKDFIDTRNHWSRDEVNFVASRDIFNGVGNNLFGVSQPMTRGMVNTVLARLAGIDTTPKNGQKWYEVGTEWAKSKGITDGTTPEASVTREQLATLLYRFYGSPTISGTLRFADAGTVNAYAQDALLWATQNGIMNGVGNNCVAPSADAQRAQVAAMMARYLKNAD